MRIHGESGIPEGSYPFWQTLFDAIPAAGRRIEIDMHAKGLDQTMIDMAVKTGMPVKAGWPNIPPSITAWAISRPTFGRWKFPAPAR